MKIVIDNSVEDCKYIDDVIYALCKVNSKYFVYPDNDKEDQYK